MVMQTIKKIAGKFRTKAGKKIALAVIAALLAVAGVNTDTETLDAAFDFGFAVLSVL